MAITVEKIGSAISEVTGAFSHTDILVGFMEDFDSMTAPKERDGDGAATTLAELVTITADHTFVSNKGFIKVKAVADTVGLESTLIGDPTKSTAIENKLTIQLLGSEEEIVAFKRLLKGRQLIVLAKEFESGRMRQIGSASYPARLSEASSRIEPTVEGENTSTLVFMDKQKYDAPIYSGEVTLQPAPTP
jgi:hypothetical protein